MADCHGSILGFVQGHAEGDKAIENHLKPSLSSLSLQFHRVPQNLCHLIKMTTFSQNY
jgi:hypothetical protein